MAKVVKEAKIKSNERRAAASSPKRPLSKPLSRRRHRRAPSQFALRRRSAAGVRGLGRGLVAACRVRDCPRWGGRATRTSKAPDGHAPHSPATQRGARWRRGRGGGRQPTAPATLEERPTSWDLRWARTAVFFTGAQRNRPSPIPTGRATCCTPRLIAGSPARGGGRARRARRPDPLPRDATKINPEIGHLLRCARRAADRRGVEVRPPPASPLPQCRLHLEADHVKPDLPSSRWRGQALLFVLVQARVDGIVVEASGAQRHAPTTTRADRAAVARTEQVTISGLIFVASRRQ